MGALSSRLAKHSLVGFDSAPFIYLREASDRFAELAAEAFEALERGDFEGVTSVVTLLEVSVKPYRVGRPDLADEYDLLLANFPHLTVVDVDRGIALRAAELRARYNLRPADALQAGASLASGATALLTNDTGLRRVSELEVIVLEDFR